MNMLNPRLSVLVTMILVAAGSRLLPHPPNMTSVTAVALFGGAYFSNRWLAFLVPLAALLLSDVALGIYWSWSIMAFQPHMEVQYLTFALIVAMGLGLRGRLTPGRVAGATLASAIVFFALTNLGEWFFQPLYPKTLAGFIACYVAAIPFFGNTLIGDAVYTVLLFGGFHLLESRFMALREQPMSVAAAH
jgi:hypothetical protein